MFVPIYDSNPIKSIKFQYVTVALILVNVAVFALTATGLSQEVAASLAVVPIELFSEGLGPAKPDALDALPVPERYTLISYMFLHADLLHISGNMLFLWVFGDNVEDAMGHIQFLIFYLLCGILAGLAHAYMMPASNSPLIGASGAVSGVIAAYLMLHPRVRVWVLFLRFIPLRVTAAIALGAWVVMQVALAVMPSSAPVAWWAHVGGLVAGAILILFMRRSGVPLFDQAPPEAQK